jgi:hypothetical protein
MHAAPPPGDNRPEVAKQVRETLEGAVKRLSGLFEKKARLLEPGELVTEVCGKFWGPQPTTRDRLDCYRAAGETILTLRCETDLTTPGTLTGSPVPTIRPGAVVALGQMRQMDREFRSRWENEKKRRRLVYLLWEYAGREEAEIADLLNLDPETVLNDREEEEALLKSLVE